MVESIRAIETFLARVGRRLQRRQITAIGLWVLASVAIGAAAIPLLAALLPGFAGQLGGVAMLGASAVVIGGLWGALAARRRWSRAARVALFVGERETALASDLLTSVELGAGNHPEFSAELIGAHHQRIAARVAELDPRRLAPARELVRPAGAAGGAAVVVALAVLLFPGAMSRGLAALAGGTEARYGGAAIRSGPVVGDVEIELEFPAYTGRPAVTLPAAAGDFSALPGTVAVIRTRALGSVVAARLVFGEDGEGADPIDMKVEQRPEGASLSARLTVERAAVYRFLVEAPGGARQVEERGHRIEIEPDQAPEVELHTPADELDVSNRKRIELAYIATDDFGITRAELVWTLGGESHRQPLPLPEPGRRSAQSKYLWDLSEVEIPGGSVVSYHVEISDNDAVSGPNVGKSKSYTLRVFSPRERHERILDQQRQLFEKAVALLGGRLPSIAEEHAGDLDMRRQLNRDTRQMVVDLGTITSGLEDDKLADPELAKFLSAMRGRYDKLASRERALLEALAKGDSARRRRELAGLDRDQVGSLEDDVVALADWIDRQDLEGMLHIADEVKTHRERIAKLLAEYQRSGSAEVKAELDRELKALERLLAEQAKRGSGMREDVLDQFVNADALKAQKDESCLSKVRALAASGDADGAAAQMKRCNAELDQSAEALESALARLRGDRFSEEQKQLEQLLGEMASLAHDEDELAGDIDEVYQDYVAKASDALRAEMTGKRDALKEKLERLERRLDAVPEAGLTPFAGEELESVRARLGDLGEMLDDGDLAEALAMARQAEAGIEGAVADLAADASGGEPWSPQSPKAQKELEKARKLAAEMTDELREATPSPDAVLGRGERRRLERLQRRQKKLRQKAARLARRAAGRKLPRGIGEKVGGKLGGAGDKMAQVERRLRRRDPAGARHGAHEAADALRDMVRETQRQARGAVQARAGNRDEPVRIPGADEYRAPKKLREDILEAMKKKAPARYKEMIERYYEELVK